MTWTYASSGPFSTGTTAGRKNVVRRLTKDTSSGRQLLSNEEITSVFLSLNGNNVWYAAADACRALASGQARSKSVGDLSLAGLGENYLALADEYDQNGDMGASPFAGGISVSDKQTRSLDADRTVPFFTRDLHAIPGVNSTGRSST